jgi:tetratricopeptide (TPR) repeat protein
VVCFASDRDAQAAAHLEQCLERRPNNPVLRGQLAGCLVALRLYSQALQQTDRALEGAPDLAEFYRSRAFIRARLKEKGALDGDVRRFEVLSRILPRAFWSKALVEDSLTVSSRRVLALPVSQDGEVPFARPGRDGPTEEIQPDEIDVRAQLARAFSQAGAPELAAAELDKILWLEPDHLAAREMRAELAIKAQRFDAARRDLDAVLNHPGLIEYLGQNPQRFQPFYDNTTRLYLLSGRLEEARTVARRARDLAVILKRHYGASQYYLARVYAVSGRSEPHFIADAADQLFRAFLANPDFQKWYRQDSWFDPVRSQVDAELGQRPDPVELHRDRAQRLHPVEH